VLQIDRIAHSSRLKKYHPHLRVSLPLVLLVLMPFVTTYWIGLATLVIASAINLWFGKVPIKLYLESLLAPAFFVITAILGILLVTNPGSDTVLWASHGFSLYITKESLNTSILTVSRAYGSLGLVYLIAFHTTIWELGQYMLRARLPKTFVELFVLCYRFIFILLEEGYEMVHAQNLRLGYSDLKISMKSLSLLISQLFVRTLMRVRYMEDSLEMRLYQGDFLMDPKEAKSC
jgi:cobalt/nickel transport system permease protein